MSGERVCDMADHDYSIRETGQPHWTAPDSAEDADQRFAEYCQVNGNPDKLAYQKLRQFLEESGLLSAEEMDHVRKGLHRVNCVWLVQQINKAGHLGKSFVRFASRPRRIRIHCDILLRHECWLRTILQDSDKRNEFVEKCRAVAEGKRRSRRRTAAWPSTETWDPFYALFHDRDPDLDPDGALDGTFDWSTLLAL